MDPRGIEIHAAKISGKLDLSHALIPFPLILHQCVIQYDINLIDAETRLLDFHGSHCRSIIGDSLVVRGSIFLRDGFLAFGIVRLLRAKISGDLDCSDGRLHNRGGRALSADGVEVGGSVFLNEGFHAWGEVSLLAARIGNNLDCNNGRFFNRNGFALCADGTEIGGSACFRQGFRALGAVRLPRAKIRHNFECSGGCFLNRGKFALIIDGAEIGGIVFLNGGFGTTGIIRLHGSSIGGDLECDGSRFGGGEPNGLSAENASVMGSLFWDNIDRTSKTNLNLSYATVGQIVDDEPSWPEPGNLVLDGFVYTAFAGAIHFDVSSRLRWLGRQSQQPFKAQPYQQLAEVFRRHGHEADAKEVLLEKERTRRKFGGLGYRGRLWSLALDMMIGHGYKPYLIMWWGLAFVVVGWTLFHSGYYDRRMMAPVKDGMYTRTEYQKTCKLPVGYPEFNALMYSLDTFLPIIDLHQEEYWQPSTIGSCAKSNSDHHFGQFLRFYLWLQIVMGWIITTLGVAGFTGLIRKD